MVKLAIPRHWLRPDNLTDAAHIQRELAKRIVQEDELGNIKWIAGVDVSHTWRDQKAPLHAVLVILEKKNLVLKAKSGISGIPPFPYVPGFLGFREAPLLVEAFQELSLIPDLIFVDGHGQSHPRQMGIASHLGVILDRPTIGVAKSILVGKPEGELGPDPGDQVPLIWKKKTIGMVVRTKARCRPLYISVGHKISLKSAVDWVFRSTGAYRFPEPIRQAHKAANEQRRSFDANIRGQEEGSLLS